MLNVDVGANVDFFFSFLQKKKVFQKWIIFSYPPTPPPPPPPKKKKNVRKIAAVRLATNLATRRTGNDLFICKASSLCQTYLIEVRL